LISDAISAQTKRVFTWSPASNCGYSYRPPILFKTTCRPPV